MLPDCIWKEELLEDLSSRRSLALKFLIPAALLLPVAILPQIPLDIKTIIMGASVLFIGVFGSAIGLLRIRESGMGERLAALPIPPRDMALQYILANSLSDGAQLAVPLAAFVFFSGAEVALLPLLASFAMMLIAANSIGAIVAAFSGSAAEGHLLSMIALVAVGIPSAMARGISGPIISPQQALSITLGGSGPALPDLILPLIACALLLAIPLAFSRRLFMPRRFG